MSVNIALFGIGLDTYWPQFTGLESRLQGYLQAIDERLTAQQATVINGGLIDNVDKADALTRRLQHQPVDAVCLYISTYALSSTVLPLVQSINKPVIILALQPEPGLPYSKSVRFPIGAVVLENGWRTVRPAALPNWRTSLTARISVFNLLWVHYRAMSTSGNKRRSGYRPLTLVKCWQIVRLAYSDTIMTVWWTFTAI